jgi:hypothetical protein
MQICETKVLALPIKALVATLLLAIIFSCSTDSSIQDPLSGQQTIVTSHQTIDGTTSSEGVQKSGALYRISVPDVWNRELVLYAHGYVSATEPIALPDLTIDDTTSIEDFYLEMGYAFATTSYSKNGWAVKEGIDDIADLVNIFKNNFGRARLIYLTGASEGGLITTLSMEKKFFLYSGGLSLCGPNGDFAKQMNYVGDFRVVFDYYFPDVIPGSPVDIPQEVMDNFETVYVPAIIDAITKNPFAATEVLKITRAAVDPQDKINSTINTFISILGNNILATNNANEVFGGQSFDNADKVYEGGHFMDLLNANIARYSAEDAALKEIENTYQTSGSIFKPLVMMHTKGDPIIPEWQQDLYAEKVANAGNSEFLSTVSINRYGHCTFTATELKAGFFALVYKVTGKAPITLDDLRKLRKVRREE